MIYFLIVLQIGDIVSTVVMLRNPHIHEANARLAALFTRFGALPVMLVIKVAFIASISLCKPFVPLDLLVLFLLVAIGGYCYAIYNNVKLILEY